MTPDGFAWLWPIIATFFAAGFVLGGVPKGPFAAPGRLALVDLALTAVVGLVLLRALGAWNVVPIVVWFVPAGLTVAGCVLAAVRWTALPTFKPGKRPLHGVLSTAASAVITVAVSAVVLVPA